MCFSKVNFDRFGRFFLKENFESSRAALKAFLGAFLGAVPGIVPGIIPDVALGEL